MTLTSEEDQMRATLMLQLELQSAAQVLDDTAKRQLLYAIASTLLMSFQEADFQDDVPIGVVTWAGLVCREHEKRNT